VCNRPDGEAQDQVSFDTLATAAQALGIEACLALPLRRAKQTPQQVEQFAELLASASPKTERCMPIVVPAIAQPAFGPLRV